ncbi:MAG: hypothetical protein MUF49_30725 [Oculatellaceae cyanobacterium Prado106]|jgi:hypothetical protein|nr:hypothetical protein [Oculatellaceae cyanobacterium Prado106]
MEKLNHYRQAIETLLLSFDPSPSTDPDLETQVIGDRFRHLFLLVF